LVTLKQLDAVAAKSVETNEHLAATVTAATSIEWAKADYIEFRKQAGLGTVTEQLRFIVDFLRRHTIAVEFKLKQV